MKTNIIGGLAISALLIAAPLSTAFAADMAVKAPLPAVPVAVTDWTGLYFDVDLGWERDSYNWNWNSPTLLAAGFGGVGMSSPSGVSVGAHIGYQQQFNWLVVGLEAGASKLADSPFSTSAATTVGGRPPCGGGVGQFCRAQIGYVSTFGGKAGVAWQDWLFYGVGGKAFGASINSAVVGAAGAAIETYSPTNASGWYVGGGVDLMLVKSKFGDLIGGVEYQHIQLQTIQTIGSVVPAADQHDLSAKEDIVWAKLTLKFNPFN